MRSIEKLEILDCTIRDGGYMNNWSFSKEIVRDAYRSSAKAGSDIIELGYHGTTKYFSKDKYGLWKYCEEKDLIEVTKNILGPKISIMIDFGKADLEDVIEKHESIVDVIRVCAHKDKIIKAVEFAEKIKEKGYIAAVQMMGFSSYSSEDKLEMINVIKNANIDYAYIADSYGSILPNQIKGFFSPFLEYSNKKMGFHPHNNLQMGFANALEAINTGVNIIDASIYGIGRAAGNLPLEVILSYLQLSGIEKYNVVPILSCIDRHFVQLKKETPWGYQLPFMLSGIFQLHPNYSASFVDLREYTIEDIWQALEIIKKKNPIGFKKELTQDIINQGMIGQLDDELKKVEISAPDKKIKLKIPYKDQHKNKDFLILANGPNLKKYKDKIDKFIEKFDPIVMGANNLSGLFEPHYHAFTNKKRFINYVDSVSNKSKLLISKHFPEDFIKEYTKKPLEKIYFIDSLNPKFEIVNGIVSSNCRTISILLMAISITMGGKRIFCAGLDGYRNIEPGGSQHFYKEEDEAVQNKDIMLKHKWCLHFLNEIDNYLISNDKDGLCCLTPTSYKNIYKSIDTYL